MQIRARDVLTTLAAAGIGGAIGSLLATPRARSAPRRRAFTEDEVIVMEAELPPLPYEEELESDAIVAEEALPVENEALDARPESPLISAGVTSTASAPADQVAPEDDRPDGENWVESMLEESIEETPADRTLRLDAEFDQPLARGR